MHIWEALKKPTGLFDSHCHLNASDYNMDLEKVVWDAADSELSFVFDIAVDVTSSRKSIELAKNYENVESFIGIDPEVFIPGSRFFWGFNNAKAKIEREFQTIIDLAQGNNIKGIGETGMDFYWIKDKSEKERQTSRLYQKELFIKHIELAEGLGLPLSIHSRNAESECLEIMKNFGATGIFHSYTGNYEVAKKIIDQGYGLGVNGIITFKNAEELRNVYRKILGTNISSFSPEDFYKKGIFFETDGPFLSPEGKRGERNAPSNVKIIFEHFLRI
ncbi:MAG: TatD family hydrolase [Candidatus Dojkabacteria bacterium]